MMPWECLFWVHWAVCSWLNSIQNKIVVTSRRKNLNKTRAFNYDSNVYFMVSNKMTDKFKILKPQFNLIKFKLIQLTQQ